jgi:hypothetical protein
MNNFNDTGVMKEWFFYDTGVMKLYKKAVINTAFNIILLLRAALVENSFNILLVKDVIL